MEYLVLLKGVLSLDNTESYATYLSALEEHQSFQPTGNKHIDEAVQVISSLLVKSTSRPVGLLLLRSFLSQSTFEAFEPKSTLWTTQVLKAFNQPDQNVALDVLSKILEKSQNLQAFGTNHLPKIYEALTSATADRSAASIRCLENCIRLYPGPSAPFRNVIERHLSRLIDSGNVELTYSVGKCHLLLQQVRGGSVHGLSQKVLWDNLQRRILGSLHSVLDLLFEKCAEMYDLSDTSREQLDTPVLQLSDEPVERAAQLYVRFRNLTFYLITALSEPFSVEKPVKPKRILDLIVRGMAVTCSILQRTSISDNIAVAVLLPKVHLHLLQLLHTLMLTLRSHMKMFHTTIISLFTEALKMTLSPSSGGSTKALLSVRIKTYELIALWCSTMRSGGRCESHAELIVEQVLADVCPFQIEFTLQVLSGARKHMSKKARRQLHKAQNEQSNLTQAYANASVRKENFSDEGNQDLCVAALRCLRAFLQSAAHCMKPVTMKVLHMKILEICGIFHELPLKSQHLYANWHCRAEIYNVLWTFVQSPLHLCPPPTEIIFNILSVGHSRDGKAQVRQKCGDLLRNIEHIVHPSKEGLLFPIDLRHIRSEFRKIAPEDIILNSMAYNNAANAVEQSDDDTATLNIQSQSDTSDVEATTADIDDAPIQLPNNTSEREEREESKDREERVVIEESKDREESEDKVSDSKQDHTNELNDPQLESELPAASPTPLSSSDSAALSDDSRDDLSDGILAAPTPKRQKLTTPEVFEDVTPKVAVSTGVQIDEDEMFADIEAAFVDELN